MRAPRLLVITDPDAPGGLVTPIVRALASSAAPEVAVQLRAKSVSARELFEAAIALRHVTHAASARLLVSARLDVAIAAKLDGVHLPESGLPVGAVRSRMPDALVGRSCHDAAGLARAAAEGADYALLGPIFAVPGKNPPIGVDGFAALVAPFASDPVSIPVLALGGVGPEHVPGLMAAGAHGVAVIRAITRASDPSAAMRAMIAALDIDSRDAR
jgi:thiamine-phosphate pyrophosphorylase